MTSSHIFVTILLFLGVSLSTAADTGENKYDGNELLEPPACGVSLTDRIYGGEVTEMDEFPWMVLLIFGRSLVETFEMKCGGSLINSRYVLTAAHCFYSTLPVIGVRPGEWDTQTDVYCEMQTNGTEICYSFKDNLPIGVRLGEWDTNTDVDCEVQMNGKAICNLPHIDMPIDRVIQHYDYNRITIKNDIGLVRLAMPVRYTENVRPICVPNPMAFNTKAYEGMTMSVSGWGRTQFDRFSRIKLKTAMTVWNLDDCNKAYQPLTSVALSRHQLCAGGIKSVDACKGDSGGPLMGEFVVNGRSYFYLVGIVSYNSGPCGREGIPVIFTNVKDYWHWIMDNISSN